jgi:hypothetical protein
VPTTGVNGSFCRKKHLNSHNLQSVRNSGPRRGPARAGGDEAGRGEQEGGNKGARAGRRERKEEEKCHSYSKRTENDLEILVTIVLLFKRCII